jgi:hypothetical protein
MNQDIMLKEIQKKGFKEIYYRFNMVLPKKFLGKGKTFNVIGGKGTDNSDNASWYRDDCKIPMTYVTGVALLSSSSTEVVTTFLIENYDIGDFVREISKNLKEFNFEVKIEEYTNDETITVS